MNLYFGKFNKLIEYAFYPENAMPTRLITPRRTGTLEHVPAGRKGNVTRSCLHRFRFYFRVAHSGPLSCGRSRRERPSGDPWEPARTSLPCNNCILFHSICTRHSPRRTSWLSYRHPVGNGFCGGSAGKTSFIWLLRYIVGRNSVLCALRDYYVVSNKENLLWKIKYH